MNRVRRWVLEDEDARRHRDVRLDEFEDAAASGDVRRRVDKTAFHVLVAAHGIEVVRLVVVERCLLAQALEHRVRVGVDVDVVRVVVDAGVAHLDISSRGVNSRWSACNPRRM